MTAAAQNPALTTTSPPVHFIPLALLPLLALFPPETRGESMSGCVLLLVLLVLLTWLRPREPASASWVLPLLLLPAAAVPMALSALSPGAAIEPLATVWMAAVAGVAVSFLPHATRRNDGLPLVLAGIGAVVAAHGISQYLWGLDALAGELAGQGSAVQTAFLERARSGRAYANFTTPAAMGALLALTLPVTAALAAAATARRRGVLFAMCAVQLAGLFATASATAIAALLLALVLAAVRLPAGRRFLAVGVPLLLLGLGAVLLIRGERVVDLADPEGPWRLRAANMERATVIARDHPWLGVGPGGFGEAYPGYRRIGDNETQHVHDLPLEMIAELGFVPGAIASLVFYVLFLGPLLRGRIDGSWQPGLAVGLAAFAIQNFADFTTYFPSLLWIAAILRGWIHDRLSPPTSREHPPSPPRALAWDRSLVPGASVIAITLVAAAILGLAGPAHEFRRAAGQAAWEGDWQRVEQQARRATRLAPWQLDGWMLRADGRLQTPGTTRAALQEALPWLDNGVRRYPLRASARYLRARVRLALGDLPGAWSDAAAAARLYPVQGRYARERDRLEKELRAVLPPAG